MNEPRALIARAACPLWKISVSVVPAAEEAVSRLLEKALGVPACSYQDLQRGITEVFAYVSEKPAFSLKNSLLRQLGSIQTLGKAHRGARLSFRKIQPQNWAEAWKRHFKALEIGSRLLIKPSWLRRRPRAGQATVILDPGLSFGSWPTPDDRVLPEPGRRQA